MNFLIPFVTQMVGNDVFTYRLPHSGGSLREVCARFFKDVFCLSTSPLQKLRQQWRLNLGIAFDMRGKHSNHPRK